MANLSETSTYTSGIYQIETTDAVQGGAGGTSNIQAQQLANRTKWLNDQITAMTAQIATLQARLVGTVMYLAYDIGATDLWVDPDGWYWYQPRGASIGNGSSSAQLANNRLQALYNVLWNTTAYTIAGGKGANANSDWLSGKVLVIPDMRGRTVSMSGVATGGSSARTVGSVFGAETATLATANLPAHRHNLSMAGFTATGLASSGGTGVAALTYGANTVTLNQTNIAGNRSAASDNLGAVWETGSGTAFSISDPSKAYSEIWFCGTK